MEQIKIEVDEILYFDMRSEDETVELVVMGKDIPIRDLIKKFYIRKSENDDKYWFRIEGVLFASFYSREEEGLLQIETDWAEIEIVKKSKKEEGLGESDVPPGYFVNE